MISFTKNSCKIWKVLLYLKQVDIESDFIFLIKNESAYYHVLNSINTGERVEWKTNE